MPPQRSTEQVQKEGRILLAHQAIERGQLSSVRQAALTYNVPEASLRARRRGRVARVDIRANNHK